MDQPSSDVTAAADMLMGLRTSARPRSPQDQFSSQGGWNARPYTVDQASNGSPNNLASSGSIQRPSIFQHISPGLTLPSPVPTNHVQTRSLLSSLDHDLSRNNPRSQPQSPFKQPPVFIDLAAEDDESTNADGVATAEHRGPQERLRTRDTLNTGQLGLQGGKKERLDIRQRSSLEEYMDRNISGLEGVSTERKRTGRAWEL